MSILAEYFEHFAPERKFKIGEGKPELASVILRRFSRNSIASEQVVDGLQSPDVAWTINSGELHVC